MGYVLVETRFLFFDGINRFTVEYSQGLRKWFIFKEDGRTDAVYVKFDSTKINGATAEKVLYEYFTTLTD